MKEHNSKNQ